MVSRALEEGLRLQGLTASPLKGPAGNVEFFAYLALDDRLESTSVRAAIDASLAEVEAEQGIGEVDDE